MSKSLEVSKESEVEVTEIAPAGLPSFPSQNQIVEYQSFLKNYDQFVDSMLNEGVDYGIIPGVEKPSLLKPGAEKLEKLFFYRHEQELVEKEIGESYSFVKYTYRTKIYNKSGQIVATCEGSCNSHEKKYRSTTVFANQATPEDKKNGRLETRTSKSGKEYQIYIIDKKDFYDLENTIMKMAQKRSYVGAILEATNSSSRFTQDVEDMDTASVGEKNQPAKSSYPSTPKPLANSPSDKQMILIKKLCEERGISMSESGIKEATGVKFHAASLTSKGASEIIEALKSISVQEGSFTEKEQKEISNL